MKIHIDGKYLPGSHQYTSIGIDLDNGDRFILFPGKDEIQVMARNTRALIVRPGGGANVVLLKTEKL